MNIDDRVRKVINFTGTTSEDLAEKTGIKYSRWTTVRKTNGRSRGEEIEALAKLFPQYAYWVATGMTDPDAGHISPEIEEATNAYNRTGTDTD